MNQISKIKAEQTWPPDYASIFAWRQKQYLKIKDDPNLIFGAKAYYKDHPKEFISHWVDTYDPRNASGDLPSRMPFVLFDRQGDLIDFFLDCMKGQENGLVEKCRDAGVTWGGVAFSVWVWLFWEGASVGWGSRKEQLVDKIGDPDSIFEKMRMVVDGLPRFFWPKGLSPDSHMTYMKFLNPENGATITGEAGDNIGRGGRKLIYFKDESAHYERPEKIEAALADNTRTQIDISSVNGLGNVFHRRREAGVEWAPGANLPKDRTRIFVFDWRDHPAKSQEWYDARKSKASADGLLHVFAQEVDRNYSAAVDGIIIPAEHVTACIDAHKKLPDLDWDTGGWSAGLDVADGGRDTNAFSARKGVVLKRLDEWGERDTAVTARRAAGNCEGLGEVELQYDCIGVGAGVKGESNRLNDDGLMPDGVKFVAWSAAAKVLDPEGRVVEDDEDSAKNKDFFHNIKAQAWWQLARRCEKTWRMVQGLAVYPVEELVAFDKESIDPSLLLKLQKELSQPVWGKSTTMKRIVDKTPEGTKSPNVADSVVMDYWPIPEEPEFDWYVG